MLDRYGRVINYLRISVTDRCNLRCCYCMPEGVQDVGMKSILTFEEIWEIVRTGVSLGITHIRITGGEPLVRKGCVDLIRGIREIPGNKTTGTWLPEVPVHHKKPSAPLCFLWPEVFCHPDPHSYRRYKVPAQPPVRLPADSLW